MLTDSPIVLGSAAPTGCTIPATLGKLRGPVSNKDMINRTITRLYYMYSSNLVFLCVTISVN
jgi:hypothetical protein